MPIPLSIRRTVACWQLMAKYLKVCEAPVTGRRTAAEPVGCHYRNVYLVTSNCDASKAMSSFQPVRSLPFKATSLNRRLCKRVRWLPKNRLHGDLVLSPVGIRIAAIRR